MATSTIPTSYYLCAGVAALFIVVYRLLQVGKRDPRMPPGPPTIPILGNAHQIPRTGLYKQYVALDLQNTIWRRKLIETSGLESGQQNMDQSLASSLVHLTWWYCATVRRFTSFWWRKEQYTRTVQKHMLDAY